MGKGQGPITKAAVSANCPWLESSFGVPQHYTHSIVQLEDHVSDLSTHGLVEDEICLLRRH